MAQAQNSNNPRGKFAYIDLMSPRCKAKYIHLDKPDVYQGKETGHSVTLMLDPQDPDHAAFIAKVNTIAKASFNKHINDAPIGKRKLYSVNSPLRDDLNKDGELTGLQTLKVSTRQQFTIVNAAKQPITAASCAKLWSGSELKVYISFKECVMSDKQRIGVVAYMSAVQVINPVTGGGGAKGADVFSDESGGSNSGFGSDDNTTGGTSGDDSNTSDAEGDPIPF